MLFAVAMLALSWSSAAGGEVSPSPRTVVLDAPGALEALQRSNPAHFDKVQKILDGLLQQPAADVPRWMEVTFGARGVSYVPVVLMSYPPKRRLLFVLDQTPYEAMFTVRNLSGEVVPLR
jgi:hypothetical protein